VAQQPSLILLLKRKTGVQVVPPPLRPFSQFTDERKTGQRENTAEQFF
jgi:hypothetical protein